jgi:hypothetical protein
METTMPPSQSHKRERLRKIAQKILRTCDALELGLIELSFLTADEGREINISLMLLEMEKESLLAHFSALGFEPGDLPVAKSRRFDR